MKIEDIKKAETESYKKETLIRDWVSDFEGNLRRSDTNGKFRKIGFKTVLPNHVIRDDVPLFSQFGRSIVRGEKKFFVEYLIKNIGIHDTIKTDEFTPKYVENVLQDMKQVGNVKILLPIDFKFKHILKHRLEWGIRYPENGKPPAVKISGLTIPLFALLGEASEKYILIFDTDALSWKQVKEGDEPLIINFERADTPGDKIMEMYVIIDLKITDPSKIKIIKISD